MEEAKQNKGVPIEYPFFSQHYKMILCSTEHAAMLGLFPKEQS
uniref:Uncharacterized protein n=1 Tax=Anguilla anguilla TaxID=7936 RepID=A0A0E9QTS2_ANGAN